MNDLKVGDIVARKSYGGDVFFKIIGVENRNSSKPVYILQGLLYRIMADSNGDDLVWQHPRSVQMNMQRHVTGIKRHAIRNGRLASPVFFNRMRARTGKVLHIDSSQDFLDMCIKNYRESGVKSIGVVVAESEQPSAVRQLLERNKPDLLVLTGHDSMKKDAVDKYSMSSYRNSKYFVDSVKLARKYEADSERLCIFAGACQSYFEAIMDAGANFASAPGRVLINALDPAIVMEKVATTDSRRYVTPQELANLTVSGAKGIGGVRTKGHLSWN